MSILLTADRAVAQTGTVASADECARFQGNAFCSSPGVIWCGTGTVLKSSDLARYAAPILWFSPDEPLLPPPATEPGERAEEWTRRVPLPQTLRIVDGEHDGPSVNGGVGEQGAVYWRVTGILTHGTQRREVDEQLLSGQLFLPGIRTLKLSYFFYYDRDLGLNAHYNDLEGAELHVAFDVDPNDKQRHRARVARVTGHAHGSELVANILQVEKSIRHREGAPDAIFPITFLVEEGKHASVPDRNGDGTYTPGYDVNIKPSDAWGLRDVFGSGVISSRYDQSMAKPRNSRDRVGPRGLFARSEPAETPSQCYATRAGLYLPSESYTLSEAPDCSDDQHAGSAFCVEVAALRRARGGDEFYKDQCLEARVQEIETVKQSSSETAGTKPVSCNFLNMAYAQKKFTPFEKTEFKFKYLYGSDWILQPFRLLAPAGRSEGNAFGPQISGFLPFGPPKVPGWFVGRVAYVRDADEWHWRTDVSLTPSITRLADWYAAVGYDWGLVSQSGDTTSAGKLGRVNRWATELGVQVRFRAYWLRVGTRFSVSGGGFSDARLVTELGRGPKPKHARVH